MINIFIHFRIYAYIYDLNLIFILQVNMQRKKFTHRIFYLHISYIKIIQFKSSKKFFFWHFTHFVFQLIIINFRNTIRLKLNKIEHIDIFICFINKFKQILTWISSSYYYPYIVASDSKEHIISVFISVAKLKKSTLL